MELRKPRRPRQNFTKDQILYKFITPSNDTFFVANLKIINLHKRNVFLCDVFIT